MKGAGIILKKTSVILIMLFTVFFPINTMAIADDEIIEQQLEMIDKSEFDTFVNRLNYDYKDYIPQYSLNELIKVIRGQKSYDFKSLLKGITEYFVREISINLHLLGELITLSIICAILKNVQSAFENDNIEKVTYGFVFLVLSTIAIQSFNLALNIGKDAIDQMVSIIQALMPIILTLLASVGGMTSVAVFNPLIFIGITISSMWIRNILLPIIYFVAVLGLISNFSEHLHVSALSTLLKQICVFLLGLFLSTFLGILVVQGAAASVVDGISIRTAKFASKNFIPIVGGIFSDTVDTIVSCSLILKNTIGFTGLIIILLTILFPIIRILTIVFIYKLAGAIIQPLGEETMVKCLDNMASHITFIAITVGSVALMFFVAITVIIASGNITVMMR
ncbi:MAG: stage III sporulation protein AE [Tepidanaerobacter acetatoxydans]|uniref:stage III sporulation protein AE n=1 Tax=Tepidanaerobacter TaxID=499228 RepID=UPI000AA314F2|nr:MULTISPECIES: stage III sporulation protein AE [Tepidanaerobacter]NLU11431.1 stage III sporulation protein AE [Tepidanaerobacter acetatoxydans]